MTMASRSLQLDRRTWKGGKGAGGPDDSLTNLQWLQEFSFLPAVDPPCCGLPAADPFLPDPSPSGQRGPSSVLQSSYGPASPPAGDTAAKGAPPSMGKPTSSTIRFRQPPLPEAVDYKTQAQVKPPYSYATLICMAMRASSEAKLTLSAIYTWITENFCYYRHAEPTWQNSIRHNLSLNKCFQKVPRGKDEPGKGGFWKIDPQYADTLVSGGFPRKRMPALPSPAAAATQGSCRRERGNSLLGPKGKQSPLLQASGATAGRVSSVAEPGRDTAVLPSTFRRASELEETVEAATSEDLELRAALGALVPVDDLPSLSHHLPLGTLSKRGPSPPLTPPAEEVLVLCREPLAEPWEEAGAEPMLGAGWGLEEDPCFAQSFLVEMPPWEG